MFTVDRYLGREFDRERYNCWDMLREAWLELTGVDIGHRTPMPPTALAIRRRFDQEEAEFVRLAAPRSPSIVLMRRPRLIPHVGLFWRDKVLHIGPEGARYEPPHQASHGFTEVRFYTNAERQADRKSTGLGILGEGDGPGRAAVPHGAIPGMA